MIDASMFDIDDTLIFEKTRKPNEYIINLLKQCKMAGHRIVIITARPDFEKNVIWTKKQLKSFDIPYDELYFCKPEFKSKLKRQLGYNFILSVGDKLTDLTDSKFYINTSTLYHS